VVDRIEDFPAEPPLTRTFHNHERYGALLVDGSIRALERSVRGGREGVPVKS
jgi:hypothetical protein